MPDTDAKLLIRIRPFCNSRSQRISSMAVYIFIVCSRGKCYRRARASDPTITRATGRSRRSVPQGAVQSPRIGEVGAALQEMSTLTVDRPNTVLVHLPLKEEPSGRGPCLSAAESLDPRTRRFSCPKRPKQQAPPLRERRRKCKRKSPRPSGVPDGQGARRDPKERTAQSRTRRQSGENIG